MRLPTPLPQPQPLPFAGALFGNKPYLYPVTPAIVLFGSFAGAIYAGNHPELGM